MCDADGRDLVLNGINSKFFVKMMKRFKNPKKSVSKLNWNFHPILFLKELK
jgi:hypothetical protein